MKSTEEKIRQGFYSYFNALDVPAKTEIRDQFLLDSKLSLPSWYYKVSHKAFSLLEQKALENICSQQFNW